MKKIQCEVCPVRTDGVVCDVPLDALDDFRASGTTSLYKPHQVVFAEGNPSTGLYLVCHGAVKLYHSDRFGRDHILEIAGPGAVLGEMRLEASEPLSISAEAVTDSQLCFLSRERLVTFIEKYPATAVRIIEALSTELAAARRKARDLALKSAESRLASLLLQLAENQGEVTPGLRLQLRFTRREIADMIAVSTETAIRLLSKLQRKNMVSLARRDVVLNDLQGLQRLARHSDTG